LPIPFSLPEHQYIASIDVFRAFRVYTPFALAGSLHQCMRSIIQASSALTLPSYYMFLVSTERQFFIEEALFLVAFLSTEALCLLNGMLQ
jgi:hypothetical protein